MKSFVVSGRDPESFVERVRTEIASHGLGGVVAISLSGDELEVQISQFGTSRLRYAIEPADGEFRARIVEEKIAPAHQAFLPLLEEKLNDVLQRVGATIEADATPDS